MEHQLSVFFHLLGFGMLMTSILGGFLLNKQYRKAKDYPTKAAILKYARPIGVLSPVAVLIMLVTGIWNMHNLNVGLFSLAWLAYKIVFFAIAAISGVLSAIVSRKRAAFVTQLVQGSPPPNADQTLKNFDRQVNLFYLVMALLIVIIIALTVYGTKAG